MIGSVKCIAADFLFIIHSIPVTIHIYNGIYRASEKPVLFVEIHDSVAIRVSRTGGFDHPGTGPAGWMQKHVLDIWFDSLGFGRADHR